MILTNLTESRHPLFIAQNGDAKLIVVEETLALLKVLAIGNNEIEQEKFQDIESAFTELDQLD